MGNISQENAELEHSLEQSQLFNFKDNIKIFKIKEPNGDIYIGERKDNKNHGQGILRYANSDEFIQYDGFWKYNKKQSKGIMAYKDGSTYIGQWKNDMRDGEGILYYKTGEKFEGTFKEGKREGKGIYYSKNNNSIFYGNYTNDVKDGKGITYYKKKKKISKEMWKNGIIISCKFEKIPDDLNINDILNKSESKLVSLNSNENKNHINSLNIIRNNKASTNNFFDIMNLVIKTYTLLYDNGDINEWKENTIIKLFEKIGLEKYKYDDLILTNQINGKKFLKLDLNDLKQYKINDIDAIIITKVISFSREYYTRYVDYHDEYQKKEEEEAKIPLQMKTPIKKSPSNAINNVSTKIFSFAKSKIKSKDSIAKKKIGIIEEDSNASDSFSSVDIIPNIENDVINKDISDNDEIQSKSKGKNLIKRRENKSITIKVENKTKKKDNIENLGFTLIKMSITNLFIHSLLQNGFDFYIPFDELQKEEEIEQDDFCFQLFMGKWQGKQIVMKCVSVDKIKNEIENNKNYNKLKIGNIIQNFIKEINICNNLRHPNIILFIGVSIHKNDFYMIFEFLENHSLYDILHKRKSVQRILKLPSNEKKKDNNTIKDKKEDNEGNEEENKENLDLSINNIIMPYDNEIEKKTPKKNLEPYEKFHNLDEITQGKILFQIAYEISVALRYIHSRNIIHCNLKTSNIFLDEDYHVKLGNFFYSKIINSFSDENKEEDYFIENQNEWTPPEIIRNGKFEESSDVYRLGLILYEILKGEIPQKTMGSNEIIGLNRIFSENDKKSRNLVNLIRNCVNEDPNKRPSLEYISSFLYNHSKSYDKREFSFEELGNFMLA